MIILGNHVAYDDCLTGSACHDGCDWIVSCRCAVDQAISFSMASAIFHTYGIQIHPPGLLTYMRITAAPPMAKSIAAFPETKLGNMCEIYKI